MSGNKARHTHEKLIRECRIVFTRRPAGRECANVFCRPGGPSGGIPPDPIPNSAVKASCAHGTAAQAAGESDAARSAKDVCKKEPHPEERCASSASRRDPANTSYES